MQMEILKSMIIYGKTTLIMLYTCEIGFVQWLFHKKSYWITLYLYAYSRTVHVSVISIFSSLFIYLFSWIM